MTSKFYETKDIDEIYSASIAVLQDLGYNPDYTSKSLGIVSATKEASAVEAGNVIVRKQYQQTRSNLLQGVCKARPTQRIRTRL